MSRLKTRRISAIPAAALAVLLAFGGASAAAGQPPSGAHLDPAYGHAGRVTLPAERAAYPGRPSLAVVTSEGALLVPSERSVLRLRPDGALDESFGSGGTLTPPAAPGATFELAGLAVDSQGRIVVAGTSVLPAEEHPVGEPMGILPATPRAVRVMRFLPNGVLDPAFADHGVLETTFGLPIPLDASGKPIVTRAWADATGVAVDSQDRVILTGGASAGLEFGCAHDWFWNTVTYAGFVARLTPAGAPDPAFGGGDGIFAGRSTAENPLHAELSAGPLAGPGDEVTYGSGVGRCPRAEGLAGLARLTAGGEPLPAFGGHGLLSGWIRAETLLPDGSIIALEPLTVRGSDPRRVRIVRIGPDGSPDLSFGRGGQAALRPPGPSGSELDSIAIDTHGRLLVGGTEASAAQGRKRRTMFLLERITAEGGVDPGFGRRGRIVTPFGPRRAHAAKLLIDPQGRALLVGTYRSPGRAAGLVIARYVLGGAA